MLSSPGEADLSADVDFSLLRESCQDLVDVHGPMTQRDFLHTMGITARMQMLFQKLDAKGRKDLAGVYDRLVGVGDNQMGTIYKVMGIAQKGVQAPYPFVSIKHE